MGVSGPTMKEILKNPPQTGEKDNAKDTPKKKGDKGAEKAPVKEKPKRKGPLDALPHSTEEWSVYDVPDEVNFLPTVKLLLFVNHLIERNSW